MRERRIFRDRLDAALEGQGSVVLLGGEAGIGKTALARDFAAEAQRRGLLVLSGHCYDLTATPPYGPWLDLAARCRVHGDLPLPPDSLQAERLEHITSRSTLFAEIQAFLAQVASSCPTVLVLEDLHWADTASIELLRHVARGLPTLPLLIVVTYRIDEPARDQPFVRHLPALLRESDGVRLDLRPLVADDLRRLVANRWELGKTDEDRLVAYLDRRAEGNPFYVTELLRMLEEHGLLLERNHQWVIGAIDGAPVPPLLRQVIDDRVARLGEAMRRPLEVAAVIGQEVPLDLWATLAAISDDDVLTIIERAIDAHLFEAGSADTQVRFVHALTREALYEGIVPPRRRLWHRQVAEALVTEGAASVDAVASHFQLAGDPRAPEWLIRAGERAQRAYAWSTAVERLAAAADLLSDVPGQEALRASLLYRCGRLQRYARPMKGIANLAAAEALAAAIGDRQLEADARYSRGLLRCYTDDFRLGLVEMTAGIEALESLPIDSARSEAAIWFADALPTCGPVVDQASTADTFLHARGVHHRRGGLPWFLAVPGRLVEAQEMGQAFVELVAQAPPPNDLLLSATAHAYHGLGIAHAALGQVQAARTAFAAARDRYRQLDHHAAIAFTLLCEQRDVVLPFLTTELDERRRIAAEAEDALSRAGGALPDDVSPRRALLGLCFLEGRWAEAREVAEDTPHHGPYTLRREVTGVLGLLAFAQGEFNLAWEQVNTLLPDGPTTIPGGIVLLDALLLQRLAAALCLEEGRFPEAAVWLHAHDRWLTWSGALLGRSEGLTAWARYWLTAGDLALAQACAEEAVSAADRPEQPHARLVALRTRGEAAARSGDRSGADEDFAEALTLADACAAPYERALTLLALAELRFTEARMSSASALLEEGRVICRRLGARTALARTEALVAHQNPTALPSAPSLTGAFALTPREVEVLRLLVTGKTNAEIAEHLFLSTGTVRNHVSTVLGKFGARTRTEAAAIARDHDLI